MPDDELIILSGLDQPLPADNNWALDKVDEYVQHSLDEHNVYIALDVCKQLREVSQIAGLALAKMLYLVKTNWQEYGIEEPFEEVSYEYVGLHHHTVERYIKVWGMFAENIAPVSLQQRNIRDLIPIANAVAQGYEITDNEWGKLSDAPDYSTVSRIVREDIKDKEPRKNALQLFLDTDGYITALKDGMTYSVGYLNINSDDDVVQASIERIIRNGGMLRK